MAISATSIAQSPTNVHDYLLTLKLSFLYLTLPLSHTLTLSFFCFSLIMTTVAGSSPVMLSGLSQGKHILRVEPTGCGTNRKNLQITFIIE